MKRLLDLNNFAATPIDYLDERASGVVFTRQFPLTSEDQQILIAATSIIPGLGNDIEEIINYQTANVRYRVRIVTGGTNPLTGSTISWASLPSGVTLSQVGGVYTLSGITSVDQWNAVKNFTWTLPANYASFPFWYLTVEVVYFDSGLNQEVINDWLVFDDRFYYVSQMEGSASMTVGTSVNRGLSASLTASATVSAEFFNRIQFASSMSARATIVCEASLNITTISGRATVTVNTSLSLPANASLTARGTLQGQPIIGATNLIARDFYTQQPNAVFSTSTPVVDSVSPSDVITVALSSSMGNWGTSISATPTSTLTLSGTKSEINAALPNVYFFPTPNLISTGSTVGTFTWTQTFNGVTAFTRNITFTGYASAYTGDTVTITTVGSSTWTPTWAHLNYGGIADALIIGGGGGGGGARVPGGHGGGGGGGYAVIKFNQTLSNIAYTAVVGAGGAGGTGGTSSVASTAGSTGSSSSIFGTTAQGGGGGQRGQASSTRANGGGSGNGFTTYTGGLGALWPNGAGGGAGSSQNGFAGSVESGGDGGAGSSGRSSANQSWPWGGSLYAGGGGGGSEPGTDQVFTTGLGRNGGGNGAYRDGTVWKPATVGTANTGGGGGGGSGQSNVSNNGNAAAGGSGVIVIKIHN